MSANTEKSEDPSRPENLACQAILRHDFDEFKRIVSEGVDFEWNDCCVVRAASRSSDPLFMTYLASLGEKNVALQEITTAIMIEAFKNGPSEEQMALQAELARDGSQLAWLDMQKAREEAEGIAPLYLGAPPLTEDEE